MQLGKLAMELPWRQMLSVQQTQNDLRTLPIGVAHIEQLARLPMHHRDPFDRMLIAQSQVDGMRLVTADGAISPYGVDVIW